MSERKPDVLCAFHFRSAECGYAGREECCDKTFDRCKALDNQENFGGFLLVSEHQPRPPQTLAPWLREALVLEKETLRDDDDDDAISLLQRRASPFSKVVVIMGQTPGKTETFVERLLYRWEPMPNPFESLVKTCIGCGREVLPGDTDPCGHQEMM